MGRESLPSVGLPEEGQNAKDVVVEAYKAPVEVYKAPVAKLDRVKQDEKISRIFKKLQGLKAFRQDAEPCRIANGFYIGSIGAAQNLEALQTAGITHILNASPLVPCFYRAKFTYMALDVHDEPTVDVLQHFSHTNSFIQEGIRKGGVLVHCYAGKSRSAAFALAYMVANMQLEMSKAFKLLRHARPIAQPNVGFMTQLEAFSEKCQPKQSRPCLCGVILEDTDGQNLFNE